MPETAFYFYFADLAIVNLNEPWEVNKNNILAKCNWSPFEGWEAIFPHKVYRRGELISENSEVVSKGGGKNLFD